MADFYVCLAEELFTEPSDLFYNKIDTHYLL